MKRLFPHTTLALALLVAGCDRQENRVPESQTPRSVEPVAQAAPLSRPPREAARPERLIPVGAGQFAIWSFGEQPRPVGYRMGDMTIIVRGPDSPAIRASGTEGITRQIRIRAPGRPDHVHENDFVGAWAPTRFSHGRLDGAGAPYLLVATALGGSQACEEIELFILRPGRVEHVQLGAWDAQDGSERAGTCPPGFAELRAFVRNRGHPI